MPTLTQKEAKILSELLSVAYSDVLSPSAWSEILMFLGKLIPWDAASSVFYDPETHVPLRSIRKGVDSGFFRKFQELYPYDRIMQRAVKREIRIWRPTDVVSGAEWEVSIIRNELLLPVGIHHTLVGMVGSGSQSPVHVWLARSDSEHPFTRNELQILELIRSHLTRAWQEMKLIRETERAKNLLKIGADQFDRPVFVFDDSLALRYMNRAARLLCDGNGQGESGRLLLLNECISRLITAKRRGDTRGGVKCLIDGDLYLLDASRFEADSEPGRWVVVAVDLTRQANAFLPEALAGSGLSPEEQEICMMLMAGRDKREIAAELSVSESEVKRCADRLLERLGVFDHRGLTLRSPEP